MNDGEVGGQRTSDALRAVDGGRAVSRTTAVGAALLPGGIFYGALGFIAVSNSLPFFLALFPLLVTYGSLMFVTPLVERYGAATGSHSRWTTSFKPGFFRFYLSGKGLVFAYLFNYAAAALALGSWLFLWIAAFAG